MTTQNRRPAPAFDTARDLVSYLEARLSPAERKRYDIFRKRQQQERKDQTDKAARARADYEEARKKQTAPGRDHNPPGTARDPVLRRLAARLRAANRNLKNLDRTQLKSRLTVLEKIEAARGRSGDSRKDFHRAGALDAPTKAAIDRAKKNLGRAPAHERGRSPGDGRGL